LQILTYRLFLLQGLPAIVVMSLGVAQVEFNLSSKGWEPLLEGKVKTWINKTFKCKGADDQSIITLVITHELDLMWLVEKFTPAKGDFIQVAEGTVFEGFELPSMKQAEELATKFFKLHFETRALPSMPSVTRELRRRTRSLFPALAAAAALTSTHGRLPAHGAPHLLHHTSRRHPCGGIV
jgi:hypothetical protein